MMSIFPFLPRNWMDTPPAAAETNTSIYRLEWLALGLGGVTAYLKLLLAGFWLALITRSELLDGKDAEVDSTWTNHFMCGFLFIGCLGSFNVCVLIWKRRVERFSTNPAALRQCQELHEVIMLLETTALLGFTALTYKFHGTLERVFVAALVLYMVDWVFALAIWILIIVIEEADENTENPQEEPEQEGELCEDCKANKEKDEELPTDTYTQRVCFLMNCKTPYFDHV